MEYTYIVTVKRKYPDTDITDESKDNDCPDSAREQIQDISAEKKEDFKPKALTRLERIKIHIRNFASLHIAYKAAYIEAFVSVIVFIIMLLCGISYSLSWAILALGISILTSSGSIFCEDKKFGGIAVYLIMFGIVLLCGPVLIRFVSEDMAELLCDILTVLSFSIYLLSSLIESTK